MKKGEEGGIYGQLNDKNPSSMGVMEGGRDGKAIVEGEERKGAHGRVQRAQLMIVPLPLLCHCKKRPLTVRLAKKTGLQAQLFLFHAHPDESNP